MKRYHCPVCTRPVGASGRGAPGLASHMPNGPAPLNHLSRCAGTGTEVAGLTPWVPPKPDDPPPLSRQPWTPPPILPDPAPYRRWRALGWTERQIAAVTGEGALW